MREECSSTGKNTPADHQQPGKKLKKILRSLDNEIFIQSKQAGENATEE